MARFEVHVRPMILPLVNKQPMERVEVDIWENMQFRPDDSARGTREPFHKVLAEYVVEKRLWKQFADWILLQYDGDDIELVVEQEPK